jgi:predicted acylesterase/phospholipase RssA
MSAQDAVAPDPGAYDYTTPKLECDIIMKGGVTSGVVYPWAVCELARTYRFRCVGGTSAGAIAAAATAAAEYGRQTGGFKVLSDLPRRLGADVGKGQSTLSSLFRPQKETRALFRTLMSGLGVKGGRRPFTYVSAVVSEFWPTAFAGALPGLVAAAASLLAAGRLGWPGAIAGAVLALIGALVGAVWGAYVAIKVIPANGFGLCRGFSPEAPDDGQLTPWLDSVIAEASGVHDQPLTFGQLWAGPENTGDREHPEVQLQMMTTDITEGLPAQMPWEGRDLLFNPDELRRYFPERVVRWMEDHPASFDDLSDRERREFEPRRRQLAPLRPMPDPDNLPVVVAARMSLSFPILISAVPLYVVDWSRTGNTETQEALREWYKAHPEATYDDVPASVTKGFFATKHWFSDGGMCSNFPVHLFDAPLPDRPTFALNLRGLHADQEEPNLPEVEKVFLPRGNREGQRRWQYQIADTGTAGLIDFVKAIAGTAQGWQDNSQLTLPGYRDRIVHVGLGGDEGGMNLNMPPVRIRRLAERGRLAATLLADQFAGDQPGERATRAWVNHRWVRYRVALVELRSWLAKFAKRFEAESTPDTPGYWEMVKPGFEYDFRNPEKRDSGHGYPWPDGIEKVACEATEELAGFASRWPAAGVDLGEDAPTPRPVLRLTWRPGGQK